MQEVFAIHSYLCQYLYELKSWERLLSFQKEELAYCKNRLAEVLNGSTETETVQLAENFQEAFLAQERIVHFLQGELKQQKEVLEKEVNTANSLLPEILNRQKKLLREIKEGELLFASVKGKFETFLHDRFGLTS